VETHDNTTAVMQLPLPVGALHVGDLGLFDLQRFAHWRRDGVDGLTRYKGQTRLFDANGQPLVISTLLHWQPAPLRQPVQAGHLKVPM
jgi:hypothetical protein